MASSVEPNFSTQAHLENADEEDEREDGVKQVAAPARTTKAASHSDKSNTLASTGLATSSSTIQPSPKKKRVLPDFMNPKEHAEDDDVVVITPSPVKTPSKPVVPSATTVVIQPPSVTETTTVEQRQRERLARMQQFVNKPETNAPSSSISSSISSSMSTPSQLISTQPEKASIPTDTQDPDEQPSQELDDALQAVLQEEADREARSLEKTQAPAATSAALQPKRLPKKRTIPAFLSSNDGGDQPDQHKRTKPTGTSSSHHLSVSSDRSVMNHAEDHISPGSPSSSFPSSLPQLAPPSPTHISNMIEAVTNSDKEQVQQSSSSVSSSIPTSSSSSSSSFLSSTSSASSSSSSSSSSLFRYPTPAKIRPTSTWRSESPGAYVQRMLEIHKQKMSQMRAANPSAAASPAQQLSNDSSSAPAPAPLKRNKSIKLTPAQRQRMQQQTASGEDDDVPMASQTF